MDRPYVPISFSLLLFGNHLNHPHHHCGLGFLRAGLGFLRADLRKRRLRAHGCLLGLCARERSFGIRLDLNGVRICLGNHLVRSGFAGRRDRGGAGTGVGLCLPALGLGRAGLGLCRLTLFGDVQVALPLFGGRLESRLVKVSLLLALGLEAPLAELVGLGGYARQLGRVLRFLLQDVHELA